VQNPAVTYGGSLADKNAVTPAASSQQTAATTARPSSSSVDLFA
jgi:hypothetical protein